jgi:nicotinamide-nucleotide amidase
MQVEIIIIGDEILLGQTQDTNSAWLGRELDKAGFKLSRITTITDDKEEIVRTLNAALQNSQIVFTTGGLGPTADDKTKQALCEFFQCGTRFDDEALGMIDRIFTDRGLIVTEKNRGQAELPEACLTILNEYGTASGMWFDSDDKVIISLPGVPHEMQHLASKVIPRLKEKFQTDVYLHKMVITQGVGESFLADQIKEWERELPPNMKLAYLPDAAMVRLRITATGSNREQLESEVDGVLLQLQELISEYIIGYDEQSLSELVGQELLRTKKTLSLAESCTGGYLSHLITQVPGCSAYFEGSLVVYSYEAKERFLDVKKETLLKYGAVSAETVTEMASGTLKRFGTDYSIAISGIAGPAGGTQDKPVGTVYIAVADKDGCEAGKFSFGGKRDRNIAKSANTALSLLLKKIRNSEKHFVN